MYIMLGEYMRYSDLKKKTLDLSGQFMREMPTNQNTKPISQENAFMNRPAVKLSISEEGLEGWRELVRKQKAEKADQDDEGILMSECVISYSTLLRGEMDTAHLDYREYTLKEEAVALVDAYGKLYDEIVQGYKSGERKAYVADPTAEDGMRRLTLGEELAYLDEAFNSYADHMEMEREYLQNMPKIELKDLRLEHATGAERERLLREKEERDNFYEKRAMENKLPEDTKEKLVSAAQEFVAQYLKGNGGSVSQILQNIQALSEFRK